MRAILAVLGAFAILPASAVTHVVAIGIGTYQDPDISAVAYATEDAVAVADAFTAAGAAERDVTVLTTTAEDPAKQPTRQNILRTLLRLGQQAGPEDRVVLFFAGHGIEQDGVPYLLAADSLRLLLTDTAIKLDTAWQALRQLRAGEVLCLIDACRNDPDAGRGDADAALGDALVRGLRPRLTRPDTQPAKVVSLLACEVGQRAYGDAMSGHGLYTACLVEGLAGGAAIDGRVTVQSLADYLLTEVPARAQRQDRQQTPKVLNPDNVDFIVCELPGQQPVSVNVNDTELQAVVQQLTQQSGIAVTLAPGIDPHFRITVQLSARPLVNLLAVLARLCQLEVRLEGGGFLLFRPSATPDGRVQPGALSSESHRPTREGKMVTVTAATEAVLYAKDATVATIRLDMQGDQLTSKQLQTLTAWAEAGHRLVVGPFSAEAFGFALDYPADVHRNPMEKHFQMVGAALPGTHPLLDGVERLMSGGGQAMSDAEYRRSRCVSHPTAVPLVIDLPPKPRGTPDTDPTRRTLRAYCVVAPASRGEILYLSTEALQDGQDAATFRANLDAYLTKFPADGACLPMQGVGKPHIADRSTATDQPGGVVTAWSPMIVMQAIQDSTVATIDVVFSQYAFHSEQLMALQQWVSAGHRLVCHDELASQYGFGVAREWNDNPRPCAPPDSHPLLRGVQQFVEANAPAAEGIFVFVASHPTGLPLLQRLPRDLPQGAVRYYLALAPYGNGEVVFRSPGILLEGGDLAVFERNWAEYLPTWPSPSQG